MIEYIRLYKSPLHRYYNFKNYESLNMRDLITYFSDDYRAHYVKDFLTQEINCFNITFTYNDMAHKMLYVGFSEWELSDDMRTPRKENFPDYVQEKNCCKISYDNFIEFAHAWVNLKQLKAPFALVYRDKAEWIYCKPFDSTEAMDAFIAEQNSKA